MGETKTYKAAGSDRLDGTPDFTVAAPVPPTITAGGSGEAEQSLSDYFGIPTKVAGLEFSALWHRAYTLVWNDWFRDENLQAPKTLLTTSGADATTYALLNRGKKHDYFTSALPWPQKGADVTIPLGTTAPVMTTADEGDYYGIASTTIGSADGYQTAYDGNYNRMTTATSSHPLYADLSDATAATINQLRLAFATQKFLEIQARGVQDISK